MARPVDTIHYCPQHIKNIEEFQRIAAAYDKELRLLWAVLGKQYENQYFDTMDEDTCARWESLIGIKLVVFFVLIKWIFFPDFLSGVASTDEGKADYVREQLTNR